jgi:NTP pyrophosphatase (non-canonical NTP hydrolase)
MINELGKLIYENAAEKGFHEYKPTFGKAGQDARHILSWLMLITTEVAEAAEAVRAGDPDNFSEELADVCIRVFDCAHALNIDLDRAILKKMQQNMERPRMHGGKLA